MTRVPTCWKHPAQSQIGVCSTCLRDRLKQLCIEEHYSSPRCSLDSNFSASAAAAAGVAGLDANVASLIAADRAAEADYRNGEEEALPKFATFLQRTHSWSGPRQQQNPQQRNGYGECTSTRNKDMGKNRRTLARIISGKEQPLPPSGALIDDASCRFELCETPKRHYKASSWPEIESQKQQQHNDHRRSSWISSLFGLRARHKEGKDQFSKELKEKRRFFGLGKNKKKDSAAASTASVQDHASGSPWQSGKLCKADFDELDEHDLYQTTSTSGSFVTNKVMPLGDFNTLCKPSLTKVRSVNGRPSKPPTKADHQSSTTRPWMISTPLRKLMHKDSSRKSSKSEGGGGGDGGVDGFCGSTNVEDHEKNFWSVSSPAHPQQADQMKRFHPSPAFPTNSSYTAYYRDYGNHSWSLHSSPMPGSKARNWNHYQQQQQHQHQQQQQQRSATGRLWENHHHHPSAFHPTGSNTWNFYLTPLRPVRSSRHPRT